MNRFIPWGSAVMVVTSEATEHTAGVEPLIHDIIENSYGRPGKRFEAVHSETRLSHIFWAFSEPLPVTSTEYDSLLPTSWANLLNPTVIVLSGRPFIAGAPNSLTQMQRYFKHDWWQCNLIIIKCLLVGFVQLFPPTFTGLHGFGPLLSSRQAITCTVYCFAGDRPLIVQNSSPDCVGQFFVVSPCISTT